MEAAERKINQILTEQNRYEIPPYQRPYSWSESHVDQLLEDLWSAYESRASEYFLGSLVVIERQKGARYEVVDGQQRLTTLSMLLARLRDVMEDEPARANLASRVMLVNPLTDEESAPRLTLREADRAFFREYVAGGSPVPEEQQRQIQMERDQPKLRLMENMKLVETFLAGKDPKKIKGFADFLLTKTSLLKLSTTSFNSAYRLFNVLNARGMPLSSADLIKTALFQRLPPRRAGSPELSAAWTKLEEDIGLEDLDRFLRHYFASATKRAPVGPLHEAYLPLIEQAEGPLAFMRDLNFAAHNHMRIQREAHFQGEALRSIRALKRVDFADWTPVLFAFLSRASRSMEEAEFLSLLERLTYQFWVRRLHVSRRSAAWAEIVALLEANGPAEELRAVFRRHADDAAFMEQIAGDVYDRPYAEALLLRLEEGSQDASVLKTFTGQITVEHVLPQTLKDEYWLERFAPEAHQQWAHKLGNLTLLSGRKNSRAQNFPFDRKREIYRERNAYVSFDMTKAIIAQNDWTPGLIASRQTHFLQIARRIWAMQPEFSASSRPAA